MRTAQEVFDHHWDAVMAGDMDRLLSDYADDALFVRPGKTAQGHAEITRFFEDIGGALDGFSHRAGVGDYLGPDRGARMAGQSR